MEYLIAFLAGAILGSFLNVCIYRIPLGKSIIFPGSRGLFCGKPIKWYDNIPLVSYVILKGKCRSCGSRIPFRYFAVELLSAISVAALLFYIPAGPDLFIYSLFVLALITVSFIDLEHQEIPDVITLPGIPVGLFLVTIFRSGGIDSHIAALVDSLIGIVAGFGAMFIMGFLGEKIYRREALGGGDVKLMAMIGAFLGWRLTLLTFFMAPVYGAGVGVFLKVKFNREIIPYGPYLAMAAVTSLLFGERILQYLFVY